MIIPTNSDNTITIQNIKVGNKIYLTITTANNLDLTQVTWTLNKKPPQKIIIGDNNLYVVLIYTYSYYKQLHLIENFVSNSFRGGELLTYLAGPDTMFGIDYTPKPSSIDKSGFPIFTFAGSACLLALGAIVAFKYHEVDEDE